MIVSQKDSFASSDGNGRAEAGSGLVGHDFTGIRQLEGAVSRHRTGFVVHTDIEKRQPLSRLG